MDGLKVGIRTYRGPNEGGKMAAGWAASLEGRGHAVRWINVFEQGALDAIRECDVFFCTISQDSSKDVFYLRSLLEVVERAGCLVYPDYHSRWHFDDKVSQAWLFQALGISSPRTWVFFEKDHAMEFVANAGYPLVFKLAAGAGSQNVKLVTNESDAKRLVKTMFGRGVSIYPFLPRLKKAVNRNKLQSLSILDFLRLWRIFLRLLSRSFSMVNRDRGYILFQEFVRDNDCDYRVTVIGGRAFTFLRAVRDGDFRASGSGKNQYPDSHEIDIELIKIAFQVRDRLKGDCIAMDFVRDPVSGAYKLLEVSPGFVPDYVALCKGYFNSDLTWVPGQVSPQECMVADVLDGLKA